MSTAAATAPDPNYPRELVGPSVTLAANVEKEVLRLPLSRAVGGGGKRAGVWVFVTVADLTDLRLARCKTGAAAAREVTRAQGTGSGDIKAWSDIYAAGGNTEVISLSSSAPNTAAAGTAVFFEIIGPGEWALYAKSAGAAVVQCDVEF